MQHTLRDMLPVKKYHAQQICTAKKHKSHKYIHKQNAEGSFFKVLKSGWHDKLFYNKLQEKL